ncbi:MAG: HlyC/CorC family transporter [Armatimonadota bacterium]|nr:MAG: HlyC/CorC family transporter [Armatimonadota bacterium]
MTSYDWQVLATLAILLALSGFFSASEIGLLSAGKYRLRQLAQEGSWSGRIVVALLERPTVMLTAVLITITGLNYTAEAVATSWAMQPDRLGPQWGPPAAILGLTIIVLIFAEVTPITYAAANPGRVARVAAGPVWLLTWALWLPVKVITALASGLVRLAGGVTQRPESVVTEQELRTIVEMEAERGGIEPEEREMIHSIFEFGDKVAREVMVPRPDMAVVERTATVREAVQLAIERRLSRLPVYDGDPDHIVGVVHAKSLLPYLHDRQVDVPVERVMRSPAFIPETKRVSELLGDLRQQQETLAIVVDEYGGTAGLITIEDLLEEIVGEIYDEYDVEHPPVQRIDDATYIVDGTLTIDDANQLDGAQLPAGAYDTVGGLIYDRVGAIPEQGARVETEDMILVVEQLDGRRVTKIRMTRKPPVEDEGQAVPGEE